MATIFLLSCSKSKHNYPCPAGQMYEPSTLYKAALQYASSRVDDKDDKDKQIFILSAKYGLLSLSDLISPYEMTLKNMPSSECDQWGKRVFDQMAQKFDINNSTFIFLAGRDYSDPLRKHLPHGTYQEPLQGMSQGVRIQWLQKNAIPDKHTDASECFKLHKLFNSMPRFNWNTIDSINFNNGIYILFERGEKYCDMDRIVRIGTHNKDGGLHNRLKNHFLSENKDGSIFRKNIGIALLNNSKHPYLTAWKVDTSKPENVVRLGNSFDPIMQKEIEKNVTKYMREKFTFVAFPVNSEPERLRLEKGIIATLSKSPDFKASADWFGRFSTEIRIVQSGMWLKQGLDGSPLSESEYSKIEAYCLGNIYDLPKLPKLSDTLPAEKIINTKSTYEYGEISADLFWQNIVCKLTQSPNEIQTIKQNGIKGKWIKVSTDNNNVFVDKAKNNTPSSTIDIVRTISKKEFVKLYPLYYKWRKKSITREEAKGGSMNSSYIFALINEFDGKIH